MMVDEIDTEVFIDQVKSFQELWDIGSPLYKDRNKKDAAWEKIASFFDTEFDQKEVKAAQSRFIFGVKKNRVA